MENQLLLRLLESRGVLHEEEIGFRAMVPGVINNARIVCAERKEDDGFHGISFWLYGENDNWYVGVWSGIYFKIGNPEEIPISRLNCFRATPHRSGVRPEICPTLSAASIA